MESKNAYPLIDRSNINFLSDEHNIGFNEGVLSDGRPYRLECWAVDQVTYLTIFISTIGIEYASSEDIMAFLEAEGLFKVLPGGSGGEALKFVDAKGNEFWSANLPIGDDENTYATSDVPLKPYELSDDKSHREPDCPHEPLTGKHLIEAEVEEAVVFMERAECKQAEFIDSISRAIEGLGFELLNPGAKPIDSVLEKMFMRRQAGWDKFNIYSLKDHVRAAIKMSSWRDTPVIVNKLKEQFGELRLQNTLEESKLDSGYRGIHVLVSMGYGVNGEIQLTVHEAWDIKLQTDSLYKKWSGYKIGYQPNVFLSELSKLIGLCEFCTVSITNKTEFINFMTCLGFHIYEGGRQYRHEECFIQSMGLDAYEILVDFDKCFNDDGTFSKLAKENCTTDMLWSDWFDYPEPYKSYDTYIS